MRECKKTTNNNNNHNEDNENEDGFIMVPQDIHAECQRWPEGSFSCFVDIDRINDTLGDGELVDIIERDIEYRRSWIGLKGDDLIVNALHTSYLRSCIRKGVYAANRQTVWIALASDAIGGIDEFNQLVADYPYSFKAAFRTPGDELDVSLVSELAWGVFCSSFAVSSMFLTVDGEAAAHRVLVALAHDYPHVELCQLVPPLVITALHVFNSEAEVFAIVSALLQSRRNFGNMGYVFTTIRGSQVALRTFMSLCRDEDMSQFVMEERIDVAFSDDPTEALEEPWIDWVFRSLPWMTLLRVLDVYLCVGPKTLFRASLSILASADGRKEYASSSACKWSVPEHLINFMVNNFKLRRKSLAKLNSDIERSLVTQTSRLIRSTVTPVAAQRHSLPHVFPACEILNRENLLAIWTHIPSRFRDCNLFRLFSTDCDGMAVSTLFRFVGEHVPTLIVVQTTDGAELGAYVTAPWQRKKEGFFGNGEAFVFSLRSDRSNNTYQVPSCYRWVGFGLAAAEAAKTPQCFMTCDWRGLAVGGSGASAALWLDEYLKHGSSQHSDTFGNPSLSGNETDFTCHSVHVWGFKMH